MVGDVGGERRSCPAHVDRPEIVEIRSNVWVNYHLDVAMSIFLTLCCSWASECRLSTEKRIEIRQEHCSLTKARIFLLKKSSSSRPVSIWLW